MTKFTFTPEAHTPPQLLRNPAIPFWKLAKRILRCSLYLHGDGTKSAINRARWVGIYKRNCDQVFRYLCLFVPWWCGRCGWNALLLQRDRKSTEQTRDIIFVGKQTVVEKNTRNYMWVQIMNLEFLWLIICKGKIRDLHNHSGFLHHCLRVIQQQLLNSVHLEWSGEAHGAKLTSKNWKLPKCVKETLPFFFRTGRFSRSLD